MSPRLTRPGGKLGDDDNFAGMARKIRVNAAPANSAAKCEREWENRPPGAYLGDERIDMKPGEKFGDAVARHRANKAKAAKPSALAQPAPKTAEPDRRAAQDANAKELQALAKETAELRAAVDRQSPAEPSEPGPKRKGFAGKLKFGGSFNPFGKHEHRTT